MMTSGLSSSFRLGQNSLKLRRQNMNKILGRVTLILELYLVLVYERVRCENPADPTLLPVPEFSDGDIHTNHHFKARPTIGYDNLISNQVDLNRRPDTGEVSVSLDPSQKRVAFGEGETVVIRCRVSDIHKQKQEGVESTPVAPPAASANGIQIQWRDPRGNVIEFYEEPQNRIFVKKKAIGSWISRHDSRTEVVDILTLTINAFSRNDTGVYTCSSGQSIDSGPNNEASSIELIQDDRFCGFEGHDLCGWTVEHELDGVSNGARVSWLKYGIDESYVDLPEITRIETSGSKNRSKSRIATTDSVKDHTYQETADIRGHYMRVDALYDVIDAVAASIPTKSQMVDDRTKSLTPSIMTRAETLVTPQIQTAKARLISPYLDPSSEEMCLSLWYIFQTNRDEDEELSFEHERFSVLLKSATNNSSAAIRSDQMVSLLAIERTRTGQWKYVNVSIPKTNLPYQVLLEATRCLDSVNCKETIMAVDDVGITERNCDVMEQKAGVWKTSGGPIPTTSAQTKAVGSGAPRESTAMTSPDIGHPVSTVITSPDRSATTTSGRAVETGSHLLFVPAVTSATRPDVNDLKRNLTRLMFNHLSFDYLGGGSEAGGRTGLAIGVVLSVSTAFLLTVVLLFRRRRTSRKNTYITFGNPSYTRQRSPARNDVGLDSPLTLSSNGYTVLA